MTRCEKCGEENPEVLVVYHRDRNRENNKPDNLAILCADCHMKMHKGHRRAERLTKVEIDNLFNVKASEVHVL